MRIELLAPAKNLQTGIAAIKSGADAVYIGAGKFGARAAAGNSVEDIKELVNYAHLFNVKVFITLNTILDDDEIEEARQLCFDLYDAGVDAFIIQDVGLLQMNLPPVAIHASTQMHNHSASKVKFLQDVGFSRVILARELSIDQIKEIRNETSVELEAFIHGSLCVSYSGRCYLSHSIGGRSANRGECAQPCRNKYNLEDEQGNVLIKDKHLLSLHDLNLSDQIGEMMDAGVMSFKIEGRLKEADYVKNITAHYRKLIDAEIAKRQDFVKSSSGTVTTTFLPDPARSFNRGFTSYFIGGRKTSISSHTTPKSTGKKVGTVTRVTPEWLTADLDEPLQNGDGLCWLDAQGNLYGARVNVIRDNKIIVSDTGGLKVGTTLMRNHDKAFVELINREDATNRTLDISLTLKETDDGFMLIATDEDGIESSVSVVMEKLPAKNPESSLQKAKEQLYKSGQTIFRVTSVEIDTKEAWFFQASLLNQLRRDLLQQAQDNRLSSYKIESFKIQPTTNQYPVETLAKTENIANKKARAFYKEHGVAKSDPSPEIEGYTGEEALMTTKMCLKYELGKCPTYQQADLEFPKTVYLSGPEGRFRLSFDCKACVMRVFADKEKPSNK